MKRWLRKMGRRFWRKGRGCLPGVRVQMKLLSRLKSMGRRRSISIFAFTFCRVYTVYPNHRRFNRHSGCRVESTSVWRKSSNQVSDCCTPSSQPPPCSTVHRFSQDSIAAFPCEIFRLLNSHTGEVMQ